jgi:hypothetical protein
LIQKYWEKWLKITEKNKDRIISKSTSDICTTGSILPIQMHNYYNNAIS